MIVATDRDTESVYVHASDGSDLTWIPHLWRCEKEEENIYHETDDYLILGLYGEGDAPHNIGYGSGAWCAKPEYSYYHFICEGLI